MWQPVCEDINGDYDTSFVKAGSSRTEAEVKFLCCQPRHLLMSKNLNLRKEHFLMKEHKRNPTNKKEMGIKQKDKKEEQKINQIEGYTVTVRFSDNGLRLEHLIDAYIQEKLFVTG